MKVLIVGNLCDDKWIGNLIRNLKRVSPDIEIDFFYPFVTNLPRTEASKLCSKIYELELINFSFLYRFPKICILLSTIYLPYFLNSFLKKQKKKGVQYDIVNIHYPQNRILKSWRGFASICKKSIITIWGSEVLRISLKQQNKMARFVKHYSFVMCNDNDRFCNQVKKILKIEDNQIVRCSFGSEMIDELTNSKITKEEAQAHFGINNKYTIVCGYNAGKAQNHLKIIESLSRIKSYLPKDFVVVLPMTYNGTEEYIQNVRSILNKNGISSVILTDYLKNEEMVYLRKCSDMFIHGQITDSNSASLAEHLLCNNSVVNASWLRYDNKEKYGIPYYLFSDFDELDGVIIRAYKNGPIVPKKLISELAKEGWSYMGLRWFNTFKMCLSL